MDTGCCGMAGTFGYEAEHYDLSMKVGELQLFPKIRDLILSHPPLNTQAKTMSSPESSAYSREVSARAVGVVSSGAACRMQIRQGTGVEALHPILLVARQIQEWQSNGKG